MVVPAKLDELNSRNTAESQADLQRFTEILKNRFEDSENIPWTDGNVLLVARKT